MNNTGLYNEDKIQTVLNKKRYNVLPNHWKTMLEFIYGTKTLKFLNRLKKVKCTRTSNYIKPDLIVTFAGLDSYISVKSGKCSNLHTEKVDTFLTFLMSLGISKETIKTILLCHYGDGTLNGTGKIRKDFHELYYSYKQRIIDANDELNNSTDFIKKVIRRIAFQGVDENSKTAEYLYYGDEEFGTMVSANQVYKYIDRKPHNWDFYENIHIGPIVLRPHGRYAHKAVISERRHNEIQCHWPNLHADLLYIEKRYGK